MKVFRLACLATLMAFSLTAIAQKADPLTFNGAQATKKMYRAIYQLNSEEEKKIKATLKNIQNALDDPRLKGKLQIELIVHGGGVALYMNKGPYQAELRALLDKGVILAQCENTLRERKIGKDQLWPFVSFVPSANGELIIRQTEGWACIHP